MADPIIDPEDPFKSAAFHPLGDSWDLLRDLIYAQAALDVLEQPMMGLDDLSDDERRGYLGLKSRAIWLARDLVPTVV